MKNQVIRISLFYCSNSISEAELKSVADSLEGIILDTISLPCSGKVNLLYLLKSIETGSDGLILATCKYGECKYLQGNYRAKKRIDHVDELLSETGFGSGFVRFVNLEEENKINLLKSTINNLSGTIKFELKGV